MASDLRTDDAGVTIGPPLVDLAELASVVREQVPDAEAALFVGTLAVGIGNRTSDVDVIVLGDLDDTDTARLAPMTSCGGRRVDLRGVRREWVLDWNRALERVLLGTGDEQPWATKTFRRELQLFGRIAAGVGLPGFVDPRQELGLETRTAAVSVAADYLFVVRRNLLLGELAHRSGDDLVLTEVAVTSVESLLQALAASAGFYVCSPKWCWEVCDHVAPAEANSARELLTRAPSERGQWDAIRSWVSAVLGVGIDHQDYGVSLTETELVRFMGRVAAVDVGRSALAWLGSRPSEADLRSLIDGRTIDVATLTPDDAAATLGAARLGRLAVTGAWDPVTRALQLYESASTRGETAGARP